MKPELARFESANPKVKVIKIDVDQKDSKEYKKYIKYKNGGYIPFTAVVSRTGKVKAEFVGMKTAKELEAAVKKK